MVMSDSWKYIQIESNQKYLKIFGQQDREKMVEKQNIKLDPSKLPWITKSSELVFQTSNVSRETQIAVLKVFYWKFVAVKLGNALHWTFAESSIRKVNGGPVNPAESKELAN